jgi:hypothetical protein
MSARIVEHVADRGGDDSLLEPALQLVGVPLGLDALASQLLFVVGPQAGRAAGARPARRRRRPDALHPRTDASVETPKVAPPLAASPTPLEEHPDPDRSRAPQLTPRGPATSDGRIIFAPSKPGRSSQIGVSVAPASRFVTRMPYGRASSVSTRTRPHSMVVLLVSAESDGRYSVVTASQNPCTTRLQRTQGEHQRAGTINGSRADSHEVAQ